MATVAVYDITNKQVGDIELNDNIFGVEMNAGLLHQAVVMQLAAQRLGTHATKTRSFVRGGGRKPWKQKGTGRARAVGRRRYGIWSASAQVCFQHAPQAASSGYQVRSFRQSEEWRTGSSRQPRIRSCQDQAGC